MTAIVEALNKMQATLDLVLQELKEQVQAGAVYGPAPFAVNQGIVPMTFPLDPPLFAINIQNDGPGNVEYRLPNTGSSQWIQLRPNESNGYNFIKGVIKGYALRDPSGVNNPVVRITGTY